MQPRQNPRSTRCWIGSILFSTLVCLSLSAHADSHDTGQPPEATSEKAESVSITDTGTVDPADNPLAPGYWGFDIGAGFANVGISQDSANEFNNEDGLSLMARLFREQPVNRNLSLHGGVNFFTAIDIGVLTSSSFSSAAFADVGVSIGKPHDPGGVYLSLSAGYGALSIGDQRGAEADCVGFVLFCDDRKGGQASGAVFRVALGKLSQRRARIQISYTRISGGSEDFPANSKASIAVWHLSLGRHF